LKQIKVIYWSGSGNTEIMAKALADGAGFNGDKVEIICVNDASAEDVRNADGVALGCPAMSDEMLEELSMEPFIESLETNVLSGKPIALFGSHGWGEGQWMLDWEEQMKEFGATLVDDGLVVKHTPNERELAKCKDLGEKLAIRVQAPHAH
jgi:flavodoxin short chain